MLQRIETARSDLPQINAFWQILWQIGFVRVSSRTSISRCHAPACAFLTRSAISCAISYVRKKTGVSILVTRVPKR